jgi:hypothetical protein
LVYLGEAGFAAIVKSPVVGRRFATFDVVLVEDIFSNGVGRAIIPTRIVVQVEPDRGDRPKADIGASPTTGLSHELCSDSEV